jgi:uncharacterized protein (DUF427 family)
MRQAIWNGVVIAESDATVVVEGNHYFPADAVRWELLRPSGRSTVCPWKGTASYYHITVDGSTNPGAVWQYTTPKAAARNIKDHVAFWHGVKVVRAPSTDGQATDGQATDRPAGMLRRLTGRV